MRADGRAPSDLDPAGIDRRLAGTRFAGRGEAWAVVDSTIARAAELADDGAAEGTWIVANWQRAGRGQHGRTWLTPPDVALALTVLLRPGLVAERLVLLTKVAGLAAARACRETAGLDVRLKAPNDLVVHGADGRWRKLGGVLVDTAIQGRSVRHALLSFGVNVTLRPADLPPALRGVATSLAAEVPSNARPPGRGELLAALLCELERLVASLEADFERGAAAVEAAQSELLVAAPDLVTPSSLDGQAAGVRVGREEAT